MINETHISILIIKKMKQFTISLTMIIFTFFSGCDNTAVDNTHAVNPILGDISFETRFGYKPNATTDETLRIKVHLEYVEDLLRKKDVSRLPVDLQNKRNRLLDLLHDYWTNGRFPKNYDYPDQRKPCFIDNDGAICAVGYLIEKTSGRAVAEKINSKHKYEYLLAMNDVEVDKWILTSGLTKEECAMIQPEYGPTGVYSYNYISPGYGISSSIIGGVNISMNTGNAIQIAKGSDNKMVPIIGLVTGAGQIALGSVMFPQEYAGIGINRTNESQKILSMVNIGLGTSTIVLSAWNLITNRKQKEKRTTWNVYTFQTPEDNTGLAFGLTRKF